MTDSGACTWVGGGRTDGALCGESTSLLGPFLPENFTSSSYLKTLHPELYVPICVIRAYVPIHLTSSEPPVSDTPGRAWPGGFGGAVWKRWGLSY